MTELIAQAATTMSIGRRPRQEDAVIADFSRGSDLGLAVLSDGMGGHNDGDLASRIIVGEMFGELFFSGARVDALQHSTQEAFQHALGMANKSLKRHAEAGSISKDTGGTLVSVAVIKEKMRWISVGDSPLYLYRDRRLHRLNEIHSLAAQIDMLARCGELDAETARNHPQRGYLTSALTGGDVRHVDCPDTALHLKPGDIILLASDGINVLSDQQICELVTRHRRAPSETLANALMDEVHAVNAADQDNISIVAIKMKPAQKSHLMRRITVDLAEHMGCWLGNAGRDLMKPVTGGMRS